MVDFRRALYGTLSVDDGTIGLLISSLNIDPDLSLTPISFADALVQGVPEMFGAVSGGIVDCSAAFAAAKAANVALVIKAGKTYRIGTNVTCGVLISQGGFVSISSGILLIFGDVIGDPATVIFTGLGTARSARRAYSVGWYAGATFDLKWDFCRRAFETNRKQYCLWPIPNLGDPASNGSSWIHTAPLYFDDPENQTTYDIPSRVVATAAMTAQVFFSPFNKTEDIFFPQGMDLEGSDLAERNIKFHGGARIKWGGKLACAGATKIGFDLSSDIFTTDEIQVEMLYPVRFGERGIDVNGVGPFIILNTRINYVLHNLAGASATNLIRVTGAVWGCFFGEIYDNHDNGVNSLTESVVLVDSTDTQISGTYYNPSGVVFGAIHEFNNNIPLLVCKKTSVANTGEPPSFDVRALWRNSANSTPLLNIAECNSVNIGSVNAPLAVSFTYPVVLGANAKRVNFYALGPDKVSGVGDFMKFGGKEGFINNVNDDAVISFGFETSGGLVRASGGGAGFWATFYLRIDGLYELVQKGANTDLVNTALTGTTGTDGKFTIGVTAGRLYFENRTGALRKVNFSF